MIPKSWDNVTIDQYVAIKKTEAIIPKDKLEEHDLRVQRACILTDLDLDVINAWSFEELLKVDKLMEANLPTRVVKRFKLNGKRYRFKENPYTYNGGQYCAVMNACKEGGIENLNRLCYLISEPINFWGKRQTTNDEYFNSLLADRMLKRPKPTPLPYEILQLMEDFKQLPLKVANPMAVFFWTLSEVLTDAILDYSTKKMKKITEQVQKEISYLEGTDG